MRSECRLRNWGWNKTSKMRKHVALSEVHIMVNILDVVVRLVVAVGKINIELEIFDMLHHHIMT